MALEKYNIEIEGLDYKEYNSDLYFEINLINSKTRIKLQINPIR